MTEPVLSVTTFGAPPTMNGDTEPTSPGPSATTRPAEVEALAQRCGTPVDRDRPGEGTAGCDEVVSRFGGDADPAMRGAVGRALHKKSAILPRLGRSDDAIVVVDELACRLGGDDPPRLQAQVAKALLVRGTAWREMAGSRMQSGPTTG
jgi:hypothetical protein